MLLIVAGSYRSKCVVYCFRFIGQWFSDSSDYVRCHHVRYKLRYVYVELIPTFLYTHKKVEFLV